MSLSNITNGPNNETLYCETLNAVNVNTTSETIVNLIVQNISSPSGDNLTLKQANTTSEIILFDNQTYLGTNPVTTDAFLRVLSDIDNGASINVNDRANQYISFDHADTPAWEISGANSNADLMFQDKVTPVTDVLYFKQGGNIGIQKNNPATALDVNGTVNASSLTMTNAQNDYEQFVPGIYFDTTMAGSSVRNAEGDYFFNIAGDGLTTSFLYTYLQPQTRSTTNKGFQLNSITVAYEVLGAVLLANDINMYSTPLVNGDAITGSLIGLSTNSINGSISTNLVYQNITLDTPVFQSPNILLSIELTIKQGASGNFRLYGVMLNYSANWN